MSPRPLLAASLAGSFTGRIWHPDQPILGGSRDRYMLEWLRSQADLLLYGAGTVRTDRRQIRFTYPELAAAYARAGVGTVPPLAVLAGRTAFDWTSPFWSTPTRKILVLPHGHDTGSVPGSVEILGVPDTHDLAAVLEALAERGHSRVLCEGGGRLYSSLCRQDLIDELFYTVTPWSLGGDAPAMTPDPVPPQRFTLISATVADQEVFLRYRTPTGRAWPIEPDHHQ